MKILGIFAISLVSILHSASVAAGEATKCRMRYNLKGWSFIYKEYRGSGSITCGNGQRAQVSILTRGGGLTFGQSEISNGKGTFSAVNSISEVFGTYAAVDGHAGATKSVEGQAMTKGEVSLMLSGKGRGFDLGFSLGAFTIRRQ